MILDLSQRELAESLSALVFLIGRDRRRHREFHLGPRKIYAKSMKIRPIEWRLTLIRRFTGIVFVALSMLGCASVSSPNISEISLGNGGGKVTFWYKIVLRKDGSAEYLGDVPPEMRRGTAASSSRSKERVAYRGTIPPEQFERLAILMKANGFFELKNDYGGVMDAVQTTTGVVFDGGRKEVSNQIGQGGEKLAEIERAIEGSADKIAWTRSGP